VVFLHFKSKFTNAKGVILGVILLGGMLVFKPSRFGDFNDKDNSAAYRIDMWVEAYEMIRYNPVLGIGKGQFLNYTNKLIAHNSFVEVMGETGFVGLFSWLALIYISLRGLLAARLKIENPRDRSLADGLWICLIGYCATSFFVTCEFELLYVFLALAMTVARLTETPVPFERRDMRNVFGLQLTGMAVFFFITRIFHIIF
jgi:O-antigen ligase